MRTAPRAYSRVAMPARALDKSVALALGLTIASAAVAALMAAFVKLTAEHLPVYQIIWLRTMIAITILGPLLMRKGVSGFQTGRPGLLAMRSCNAVAIMLLNFYGFAYLPLAQVTAIHFTKPLFLTVLAALFLAEPVRKRRGTATLIGFLGILVIVQPGADMNPIALIAVAGAFLMAVGTVMVKKLSETTEARTLVFYSSLTASVCLAPFALNDWVSPTSTEWAMVLGIGLLGTLAQTMMIRAYALAEATLVAPFDYTRILFAGAYGFLFFSTVPSVWTLLGAVIIIGSTLYIAFRASKLGRKIDPTAEAVSRNL